MSDDSSSQLTTYHTPISTSFSLFQASPETLSNKTWFSFCFSRTFLTKENIRSLRGKVTFKCGCCMDMMFMALDVLDVAMALCQIRQLLQSTHHSPLPYLDSLQTIPSFPRDSTKQYWILPLLFSNFPNIGKHSKSKRYSNCQLWMLYQHDVHCVECSRCGHSLFMKQMTSPVYSQYPYLLFIKN
jgi:hypothetical protein